MVDKVYKQAIPAFRTALEGLKVEFSKVRSKTDWNRLRVEPLLEHVKTLDSILTSKRFAGEFSRLRRGMPIFHSDLVYFRENVKQLEAVLQFEKNGSDRKP